MYLGKNGREKSFQKRSQKRSSRQFLPVLYFVRSDKVPWVSEDVVPNVSIQKQKLTRALGVRVCYLLTVKYQNLLLESQLEGLELRTL